MKETTSQPRRIDDSTADTIVAFGVSFLLLVTVLASPNFLLVMTMLILSVMFIGSYVGIRYQN